MNSHQTKSIDLFQYLPRDNFEKGLIVVIILFTLAACRQSLPKVQEPTAFTITNQGTRPLFIQAGVYHTPIGQGLQIQPQKPILDFKSYMDCDVPMCAYACDKTTLCHTQSQVFQLVAGQTWMFEWNGVVYVPSTAACQNQTAVCTEAMPLPAGRYDVTLCYGTQIKPIPGTVISVDTESAQWIQNAQVQDPVCENHIISFRIPSDYVRYEMRIPNPNR